MDRVYRESYANVHRGVYTIAEEATNAYEGARAKVARLLGGDTSEIVFTKNVTEAINLVAYSWARANLHEGDVVVLTEMEHHANIVPWHMLAAERGVELRWIPLTDDYRLDLTDLDRLLDGAAPARRHRGLERARHDQRHAAPRRCGPRGRRPGAGRRGAGRAAHARRRGGVGRRLRRLHRPQDARPVGHRRSLGPRRAARRDAAVPRWRRDDPRRDPGRVHHQRRPLEVRGRHPADRRGASASARRSTTSRRLGLDAVREHEVELTRYALDALTTRFGDRLTIYGPRDLDQRGGAMSFLFDDIHAHDVSQVVDEEGVCVRAGHHCAKPLMRVLGVPATTRASFYVYNDEADVDALVEALVQGRAVLRDLSELTMAGLEDLYREIILDHYRAPRNRGELPVPPAHRAEGFNPLCGDEVILYLDVDDGVVRDIRTEGQGCSISQASTSMMSAAVKGKSVDEARRVIRAFKALMSIHESQLEGGSGRRPRRRRVRGRSGSARRARGAPGRREVPRPHQVRHAGLEHAPAGPRRG